VNIVLLLFLFTQTVFAVTLDDYINQVTKQNSRIESTQNFLTSADLRKSESKILTTIRAFSLAQIENDHRQPQFAAFEGVSKEKRTLQFGLEQNSSLGITHKLYTNYSYLDQKQASFIPNPKIANSAVVYEFTVPLLKNFSGKITKIQQDIIKSRNEGTLQTETFSQRKVMAESRTIYWRLKTAREIVRLQKEMIHQGEKFLSWTQRRVRDKLGEDSDLKQAEAILEVRRFDLQKETLELRRAEQAFNSMRESELNEVIAELDEFPADNILPTLPSEKEALARPDLLALEAQLTAENLEMQQISENNKMDVSLIGSASSNGLSYKAEPDYSKTFSGKYPAYLVGLRLSVPLDRSSVNDVQQAANSKRRGLTAAIRRNRYESLVGLSQLRLDYEQLQAQLRVVRRLVNAQDSKLKTERERSRYGRTSTFQLLTFEQEYQQAMQDLIRTQGQIWQLSGQAILYTTPAVNL
jgi:hypothetical protein